MVSTGRRVDVRVKRTYRNLIDGMFQLLNVKAFEDITVLEICAASGVHRATFYKHFVDKYDFLNFCFTTLISELPLDRAPNDITNDDAKQYYMEVVTAVVRFVEEHKQLFINVSNEKQSQMFMTSLIACIARTIEMRVHAMLDDGACIESPAPMIANFYAGALVSLLRWWVMEGKKYTAQDLVSFASNRVDEILSYYAKKKSIKDYH